MKIKIEFSFSPQDTYFPFVAKTESFGGLIAVGMSWQEAQTALIEKARTAFQGQKIPNPVEIEIDPF